MSAIRRVGLAALAAASCTSVQPPPDVVPAPLPTVALGEPPRPPPPPAVFRLPDVDPATTGALAPAGPTLGDPRAGIVLTEVGALAGVRVDDAGYSAAWGDIDGDGWTDLLVPLVFAGQVAHFRNRRDGTFEPRPGLPHNGAPMCVAVGDWDNDGRTDVVSGGANAIVLYRTEEGTPQAVETWTHANVWVSMVGFFDVDANGLLDLYATVSTFTEAPSGPEHAKWCNQSCSAPPLAPPTLDARNRLWMQTSVGVWDEVTDETPVADPWRSIAFAFAHWLPGDRPALYVADDLTPHQFWAVPFAPGSAAITCAAQMTECFAGMGVVPADLDGDGLQDLLVTNTSRHVLYRNRGDGRFDSVMDSLLAPDWSFGLVGWGVAAPDLDADGDLDLVIAHSQPPNAAPITPEVQRPGLLVGHEGRFEEWVTEGGEPWLADVGDTYGVQTADYDRDGDLDLVLVSPMGLTRLYRNDSSGAGHSLKLRIRGTVSNRSAIGTVVRLRAGGRLLVREVLGASGAAGMNDTELHFGLGAADRAEDVVVKFPAGGEVTVGALDAGATYQITEPTPDIDGAATGR